MFITRFVDFGALNPVISCFVLRKAPRVEKSKNKLKRAKMNQIEKMTRSKPCYTGTSHTCSLRGCRPRVSQFTQPGH